jgi:predicted HTH domain antitoxin
METLKLDLPPGVIQEKARLPLAIKLYKVGKLSLGQAAELVGHSKRAFTELLGRHGVSILGYPPEDLREEVSAASGR